MANEGTAQASLDETGRTYAPHEAVIEASRCLMCDDPPCNTGCPAGVDVRRFIRKIRFGNHRGASRLIREANIMVGICGRVCPQEMLCMEHCTRTNLDTPIDIAGLQRFAGDVELASLAPLPDSAKDRKERVAIIGAGPAGLGAAVELRKSGVGVTVFEKSGAVGGVLTSGIPPFRLDQIFAAEELDYVRRLGADVQLKQAAAEPAELLEQGFSAVFIGIGLGRAYTIGLDGEDLPQVHVASDLLTAISMGERPSLGSRVVVIGGGNVAMDAAMAALRLGADRVDVCCLESYEEMPAFRSEIEEVQSEGIVFHTCTRPVRIVAEGNKVVGYEGVGTRWKEPGLLIPSNAVDVPGTEFGLAADSIIEAIGTGVLDRFEGVETDERGVVRTDPETMATSLSGVFAGGDVVSGGATAVRAYAEGKRAAEGIIAFLDSRGTEGGGR
jgi:glutamate synthase (NADPH/NADH) small chain